MRYRVGRPPIPCVPSTCAPEGIRIAASAHIARNIFHSFIYAHKLAKVFCCEIRDFVDRSNADDKESARSLARSLCAIVVLTNCSIYRAYASAYNAPRFWREPSREKRSRSQVQRRTPPTEHKSETLTRRMARVRNSVNASAHLTPINPI